MAIFANRFETAQDPISKMFGERSAPMDHQQARLAQFAEDRAAGAQEADSLNYDPADPSPEAQIKRMEHKMAHGDTLGAMKIGERLSRNADALSPETAARLQDNLQQGISDLAVMGRHAEADAYRQMTQNAFTPQSPGLQMHEWKPAQPNGPDMAMGGGMG